MTEWKTAQLGDLLNESQIWQLKDLANNGKISFKKIKEVILQDDSKWKGILIPNYFAYALLNEFQKRGINGKEEM